MFLFVFHPVAGDTHPQKKCGEHAYKRKKSKAQQAKIKDSGEFLNKKKIEAGKNLKRAQGFGKKLFDRKSFDASKDALLVIP